MAERSVSGKLGARTAIASMYKPAREEGRTAARGLASAAPLTGTITFMQGDQPAQDVLLYPDDEFLASQVAAALVAAAPGALAAN